MRTLYKIEIHRMLRSKWLWASWLIGITIVVIHFLLEVTPNFEEFSLTEGLYPVPAYNCWIGADYSMETYYFYLIFPLLAALPFSDTLFTDMKNGYVNNVCLRSENRMQYFKAKFLTGFLSGGLAVLVPIIISFCLACTVRPLLVPQPGCFVTLIGDHSTFPNLYYNMPFMYVLLFMALAFVYAGTYACFGLMSTFYVNYRFFVLIAPFMLHLFLMTSLSMIGLNNWAPINFLQPSYDQYTLFPILIEAPAFLAISYWIVVIDRKNKDVL